MANRSKPATGSNVKIDASAAFGYKVQLCPAQTVGTVARGATGYARRRRCAVTAGVLMGYRGGVIAPRHRVVEQQLRQSQAQVRRLEKCIRALEAKLGMVEDAGEPASTAKAY